MRPELSVDPRDSERSGNRCEVAVNGVGDAMQDTSDQHRGPISAMLMAKALARWEGEGGALPAQRQENDARVFRGRERTNPLATAPSQESGK